MTLTTRDILAMPDGPAKRAMLAQLAPASRAKPLPLAGNGEVLAFSVTLALATTTEKNTGGHWTTKAKRARTQRETVRLALERARALIPPLPVRVSMVRLSRGTLDAHDNLQSALSHVVDGIAEDFFGTKDNDDRIEWATPTQEVAKQMAVRITIEPRGV